VIQRPGPRPSLERPIPISGRVGRRALRARGLHRGSQSIPPPCLLATLGTVGPSLTQPRPRGPWPDKHSIAVVPPRLRRRMAVTVGSSISPLTCGHDFGPITPRAMPRTRAPGDTSGELYHRLKQSRKQGRFRTEILFFVNSRSLSAGTDHFVQNDTKNSQAGPHKFFDTPYAHPYHLIRRWPGWAG
jgi:hypothetical protein